MQLEFQNPTRPLAPYLGTVFILEGVVEVFDRGTLSVVAPPAP
jgi:hypothetical protein